MRLQGLVQVSSTNISNADEILGLLFVFGDTAVAVGDVTFRADLTKLSTAADAVSYNRSSVKLVLLLLLGCCCCCCCCVVVVTFGLLFVVSLVFVVCVPAPVLLLLLFVFIIILLAAAFCNNAGTDVPSDSNELVGPQTPLLLFFDGFSRGSTPSSLKAFAVSDILSMMCIVDVLLSMI